MNNAGAMNQDGSRNEAYFGFHEGETTHQRTARLVAVEAANKAALEAATGIAPIRTPGYRDLSLMEMALINKIKSLGAQIEAVSEEVYNFLTSDEEGKRIITRDGPDGPEEVNLASIGLRWIDPACMDLQTGLMKLTRSVARPLTFA